MKERTSNYNGGNKEKMDASATQKDPKRVRPLMATWMKEQCTKAPVSKGEGQFVLKVEYQDKVMELDLLKISSDCYTLVALKSKVFEQT